MMGNSITDEGQSKLLGKALPAIIETEEENERMLAAVEPLFDKGKDRTPEENWLYKLMLHLIQDFEESTMTLTQRHP
jgi:hypothetical protein